MLRTQTKVHQLEVPNFYPKFNERHYRIGNHYTTLGATPAEKAVNPMLLPHSLTRRVSLNTVTYFS